MKLSELQRQEIQQLLELRQVEIAKPNPDMEAINFIARRIGAITGNN